MDFKETRRLLSQLVPFLKDRKSSMLYPNLTSLTTDIWSRFQPNEIHNELFSLLLRDASTLIQPLAVTAVHTNPIDPATHPHVNLVLMLSDLARLFEREGNNQKPSHVVHKLLFYAAHVLSTPSPVLRALALQLRETASAYSTESSEDHASIEAKSELRDLEHVPAFSRIVLIEEI